MSVDVVPSVRVQLILTPSTSLVTLSINKVDDKDELVNDMEK